MINRFDDGGIVIANSAGSVIEGNYIGTDITGTAALGNGGNGVFISDAADNTVGGTSAGSRNVISGNGFHGVSIASVAATGNRVLGNLIGVDSSGTIDLGNARLGVGVFNAANNVVGALRKLRET